MSPWELAHKGDIISYIL